MTNINYVLYLRDKIRESEKNTEKLMAMDKNDEDIKKSFRKLYSIHYLFFHSLIDFILDHPGHNEDTEAFRVAVSSFCKTNTRTILNSGAFSKCKSVIQTMDNIFFEREYSKSLFFYNREMNRTFKKNLFAPIKNKKYDEEVNSVLFSNLYLYFSSTTDLLDNMKIFFIENVIYKKKRKTTFELQNLKSYYNDKFNKGKFEGKYSFDSYAELEKKNKKPNYFVLIDNEEKPYTDIEIFYKKGEALEFYDSLKGTIAKSLYYLAPNMTKASEIRCE